MLSACTQKVIIDYPCPWQYRVIGECEQSIRIAITEIITKEHTWTRANQSSSGKYQSFSIDLIVESEEERNHLFHTLKSHPAIKMVI